MTDLYSYNSFCSLWSVRNMTVINFEPSLQFIPEGDAEVLKHLTAMKDQPLHYLASHFSQMRIAELLQKRIVVSSREVGIERTSRQTGFLSLCHSNPIAATDNIRNATVLVLGAGAIGTHVAWSLAALGVKELRIVDNDVVELSNLNRQLVYAPDDVGKCKVEALCTKLSAFNPEVVLMPLERQITCQQDVEHLLDDGINLVVKAIDTPESVMDWVNAACVAHGVPYIASGFVDTLGVVGPVYLGRGTDCMDCFVRPDFRRVVNGNPGPTCAPMAMIVASRVAVLCMKILTGDGPAGSFGYEVFDYKGNSFTQSLPPYVAHCKTCGLDHATQSLPAKLRDWAREVTYLSLLVVTFILTGLAIGPMLVVSWVAIGFLYFATGLRQQDANIDEIVRHFAVLMMVGLVATSWLSVFSWWHGIPKTALEVRDSLNSASKYIMVVAISYCVVVVCSYWAYTLWEGCVKNGYPRTLWRRKSNA